MCAISTKSMRPDGVGDFAHAREIDDAGVGGSAGGDHFRGWNCCGVQGEGVVIDALVLLADAVVGDLEEAAGEVRLVAMGEVAAMGEIHGEDAVAGLEDGEVDGHVGLAAGVGLDVGVLGAEELAGAIEGELLDDIDILAAAVPALAGVALGVFVGEAGALGLHDGAAGEVFGSDELDVFELAKGLAADGIGDLGIDLGERSAGGGGSGGRGGRASRRGGRGGRPRRRWRGRHPRCGGPSLHRAVGGEAEDVGVVMLAGDAGGFLAIDQGGADVGVAIGGDAHADAAFAEEDADSRSGRR